MKVGIALALLGVVFLLNNLGLVPVIDWGIIWPIVLIAVGISMVLERTK